MYIKLILQYYDIGIRSTPQSSNIRMSLSYALVLLLLMPVLGQNEQLGIPPVRNFTKKTYQAAPQNWDIIQADNQVMYFSNNLGLLSFDGNYWHTNPIGNKTIVRSICILDNNTIFAGGQGDIGLYTFVGSGEINYQSIADKMPAKYKQFEDVWHSVNIKDTVFFNTTRDVFVWDGTKITVFPFNFKVDKLVRFNDAVWLYIENGGVYHWNNREFVKKTEALPILSPVTGLFPWNGDTIAISTLKDGMFYFTHDTLDPLVTRWNNYFKKNWITKLIILDDGSIAIGTAQNGVFVFDPKNTQSMSITTAEGLQNNNILALYQDQTGDLWVASEHGIDLIQYHSPYRLIYPDGDLKGAGYAAAVYQNDLYLGTTNGVYVYKLESSIPKFKEIPGSKGQVWKLDTLHNKLFLGHHSGAFQIKDEKLLSVLPGSGTWRYIPLDGTSVAFGTYEGIGLFNTNNIITASKLSGFKESSRIMIKDLKENIWMSHPYRGIFKININTISRDLKAYKMTKDYGLPSDLGNYIFLVTGLPYVCSDSGIYYFDYQKNVFVRDSILELHIGKNKKVQLLYEDPKGNIWYYTEDGAGVLEISIQGVNKKINKRTLPQMPEKLLGGFEFMLALDSIQYLFGCDQGFVLLNKDALKEEIKYNTIINSVYLAGTNETLIYRGIASNSTQSEDIQLNLKQNAIRFHFSCTSYGEEIKEYRYQLEGLDKSFSEWTSNTEVQFNNLKPGKYKFLIQSKVGGLIQDSVASFSFQIKAPWYLMRFVQIVLLLLFSSFIFIFFILQKRKFEHEKLELESQHQEVVDKKIQLVEKTEQEIIQLKNEKLQSEIQHKNNELASTTMHLVQKQELLSGVQNELKKILKNKELHPVQRNEIKSIIQMLQQDARLDNDWEQFSNYFDEVHGYFLLKLKEKYPQLSPHDHKLCAYLRMNLSSKEIASLMNISLRGVEGARYRLRKKLGLPQDTNLVEFMNQQE
jgi:DNA-binding CsgD family transcriptional regulator